MKLLFASDSLKGSLSSMQTADLLDKAAREVFRNVETIKVPMSDGGEGLIDAVIAASGGKREIVTVHDPLMGLIEAPYAIVKGKLAVIEMAMASGLPLIDGSMRDPRYTTSYGTGELIRHALDSGCEYIVMGIGGSATNDGGMGALRALGAKFLDERGRELEGRGIDLTKLVAIDLSELDERIQDVSFTVMCDVTNPRCGPNGATWVYGPQKGGTPEMLEELEAGMEKYRDLLYEVTGHNCDNVIGAGAAGGFGAASYAVLGAELRSGIDTMLGMLKFDDKLEGVDLVITGEGCADKQSVHGKVMQGVARRAEAKGIPVIGLVGSLGEGWEEVLKCGISRLICITGGVVSAEEAMADPEKHYYDAALRMFETYKDGSL